MAKNPDWTRDEIILALDLYLKNRESPPSKTSQQVGELSQLLGKLCQLNAGAPSETFRNPPGVYLKMMNLRAHDPQYTAQGKVGMTSGGSMDKVVWDEFSDDLQSLHKEAQTIRSIIENEVNQQNNASSFSIDVEGEEGGIILRTHLRRERNQKLVKEKLKASAAIGDLTCEVCGFDFESAYGALGAGYIEVHHLTPVHLLSPGTKTKLDDLALLCANCHRMAHRRRATVPLAELKAICIKN